MASLLSRVYDGMRANIDAFGERGGVIFNSLTKYQQFFLQLYQFFSWKIIFLNEFCTIFGDLLNVSCASRSANAEKKRISIEI